MTLIAAHLLSPGAGGSKPSIDALLGEHYTDDEIGGPSPHGWHTIADYMRCHKITYLSEVRGLESARPRPGRDVGTLLHACLARHYLTGGVDTLRPIQIIEPHYPEYAEVAHRILEKLRAHYWPEEAKTFDVRAVETQLQAEIRVRRPEDKRRHLAVPITCRCDLIIGLHDPGTPCAPSGPVKSGVYIQDHKFVASMRRDYLTGFGMDGQILMNALCFKRGGYEQVYGPLRGFIVNIVAKTKDPQVERVRIAITDEDLDRFERVIAPHAAQRFLRLRAPHKTDPAGWASEMNIAVCTGEYGRCDFFAFCESHGRYSGLYRIRPGRTEAAA